MTDIFRSIAEPIQTNATVKAVFGEPISAQGRTLIPVARVAWGFGGGSGHLRSENEGGGGGGGAMAFPLGVIDVTEGQTRFVPLHENRKLLFGSLAGFLLGFAWASLSRRKTRVL